MKEERKLYGKAEVIWKIYRGTKILRKYLFNSKVLKVTEIMRSFLGNFMYLIDLKIFLEDMRKKSQVSSQNFFKLSLENKIFLENFVVENSSFILYILEVLTSNHKLILGRKIDFRVSLEASTI